MSAQQEALLNAYYDGELSGLSRWRFERRLRRTPALQRELAAMQSFTALLRERDAARDGPDLWDRIALGLPAADARRREADASAPADGWRSMGWLKPVGAMVATAVVVGAYLYPSVGPQPAPVGSAVRWIDAGNRGVMVLEDDPDSTIIWVLDDAIDGASMGGRSDLV